MSLDDLSEEDQRVLKNEAERIEDQPPMWKSEGMGCARD